MNTDSERIPSRPFGYDQVLSVLISVTTDMSPTGDLLVTSIFAGENVLLSLLRGF